MRIFQTFLAATCTLSLMVTGAFAQSTKPKAKEPAKQETLSKKTDQKKKPELSDHQKELDKLLLGAWAVVAVHNNAELTDEMFRKAFESCRSVPLATELDVEPGLKSALPDRKEIRGQLIYFRTAQGLQRYEANPSRVFLLPNIRKAVNAQGRTIWQVSGQFARFSIAFAGTSRGLGAILMLEENRMFLKCDAPPQQNG